jgi:ADP-ribose pyrophosphatase YjhB (NUDIX family)
VSGNGDADLRLDLPGGRFIFRVAAVISRGDDLLMVSNPADDHLYTVGGAVWGETTEAALAREVEEETGLQVARAELCAVAEDFFHERGADQHEVCFYYRVALEPGREPTARSVNLLGQPESLLWAPRHSFGRDRPAYPPFLPELVDGGPIRHYVTRSDAPGLETKPI